MLLMDEIQSANIENSEKPRQVGTLGKKRSRAGDTEDGDCKNSKGNE